MVTEVADVDYIVTDTVSEAYLLESNLIKKHRPRFNIRLQDDKSYPFVKITLGEDFPRIVRTRRLVRDGAGTSAVRIGLERGRDAEAASEDLPVRTCNLDIPEGKRVLERPCLLYYINRWGPCIQAGREGDYRETIGQIVDFLDGRQEPIAAQLRRDMTGHSEALRYEQAAATRDKLRAVERTMEQQKMAAFSRAEHDAIGMARAERGLPPGDAGPQQEADRPGALHRRRCARRSRSRGARLVPAAVLRHDRRGPRALLVAGAAGRRDDLAAYLADRRGVRVTITVPGAARSGASWRSRRRTRWRRSSVSEPNGWPMPPGGTRRSMSWRPLSTCRPPSRIECYDMSNIQGTSASGRWWCSSMAGRSRRSTGASASDPARRRTTSG